ncbi:MULTISPECIES: Cys-Gln thioester bond-forming surface protein [unclassified Streptomyces]|uniref:Cys-Gln thioester bond-forming surface protein n=1 Tax=Streptomyces evansiae TaxID=3075535 RepID=A0ABU2QX01_9ACTN|nr:MULTISPECIES: Cys-Gln thioester bond-forming surface protein [unclassified Streptomyces]MDT0408986.1 Cys-Gln thioester bond-forming surface protein [Streptomyces sp. DSM 41979]MYQ61876.1 Cys-Gln thioester bond-forming surface protein [Streptomyces sp. SID4926]MYR29781.1 Cys-Gln thioester bond-forming surface protein [Streptomyces sp. SID4945]SCD70335.1 TQXA domain-containing protein [Streptomyces sp. DfronAA-171]SCF47646.1 TQXA domain-containing protein [Streptomyces sp. LcepLS]
MFFVRRRGAARLAAAVFVSGLVATGAITGASAAAADEASGHQGGATATLGGLSKSSDAAVIHENGKDQRVQAGLFTMAVEQGGALQTYCIDIHHPTQDGAKYQETPWSGTSLNANPDAGKIRWILENSYPQVNDLAGLAAKAGSGALTEGTAAAGTQVAIWRYSDGADVDAVDPAAEKLADYLEKAAQNVAEPKASLGLEPAAVSGKAGEKLGPVTVHTNAGTAQVEVGGDAATAGVKLVDKAGKAVESAADGAQLWFDVPAGAQPGSASVNLQATTNVPVGRAFASETRSQTQILAGSSDSTVSATASATWGESGPIPAVSAEKNCAKGGVDVTASNQGDKPFTFELAGQQHTVEAGKSATITVPVKEDQSYDLTVKGPNGFTKEFKGVLDCKVASSGGASPAGGQSPLPSASPTTAAQGSGSDSGSGGDLAATGGSSATPVIAGVAVVLVVLGAGTVFFIKRRKPAGQ